MRTKFFASIFAIPATVLSIISCNSFNPGPLPEDIVGDQPGELEQKIKDLLDQAGTDTSKVEFAEISTTFTYKENDNKAYVSIQIISPENKDKMVQYDWNDMKDRRNHYEMFELTVSSFDDDVIDNYDGYKDMLFKYSDAAIYLKNLPTYCKEALEASGYKENGCINSFNIEADRAFINVGYKGQSSIFKTYNISEDKNHIVIPE